MIDVLIPPPFSEKPSSKMSGLKANPKTAPRQPDKKVISKAPPIAEAVPVSAPPEPSTESFEQERGSEKNVEPVNVGVVTQAPVVLEEVPIVYPEIARRAGVEGLVELKLVIDQQGKVRQADVIRGPGYGLDEAALKAIREFKFSPAKIGEQRVAVRIVYKYRFRISR